MRRIVFLLALAGCQPPADPPVGMLAQSIQEIHPPDGNCGDLWYLWKGPWGDVPVRSNSGACDLHGTYGLEYECAELVDRFFLHNMFGDPPGQPMRIWANAGYDSCNYVWNNLRTWFEVYGPKYTHGGPEPVPGDALEWDDGAGSFHTALVVENWTDGGGQRWLGAIQQNAYWCCGTAWPTRNVKWNGTTFSSTWQNVWDNESVCWIHAKKNTRCAGAGGKCAKASDCCAGESCEHGACVTCPGAAARGCTVNGCGGGAGCAVATTAGVPTAVTVDFFNESGAAWPAASTVVGTASGAPSALAGPRWRTSAVAAQAEKDTAPSEVASFVVPLDLAFSDGVASYAETLQVFVDGKPVGAPLALAVSAEAGALDAALDSIAMPPSAAPATRVQASLLVTNAGGRPWRGGRTALVALGDAGALRDESWPQAGVAAVLPADVAPGKSATVSLWLLVPEGAIGAMAPRVQLSDADAGRFGPAIELPLQVTAAEAGAGCAAAPGRADLSTVMVVGLAIVLLALRRKRA